jgi:hypothetical protein
LQIALSVVLLFGASLFVRTFRNLDGQKFGFERENLLLFEVDPERGGYKGARGIALHNHLLERIKKLPGVRSVTFSQIALLSGWHNTSPFAADRGPLTPPASRTRCTTTGWAHASSRPWECECCSVVA